jgi:hypothetical protein
LRGRRHRAIFDDRCSFTPPIFLTRSDLSGQPLMPELFCLGSAARRYGALRFYSSSFLFLLGGSFTRIA